MKLVIAALIGLLSYSEAIKLTDDDRENKFYPYVKKGFNEPEESWRRKTTDMVDDNAKVADIKRDMINNPKRSRKEWKDTRDTSIKVNVDQHA